MGSRWPPVPESACWVAGRAGLDLDQAIDLAGRVGQE
jgi:hypothetical protein